MVKYTIGQSNHSGEMDVHCATTKQRLGTLRLKNGRYTYAPVGTSIEVGEYTNVIKQHLSEQLVLVRQAA
ncbi:MAG: hypothetical protein AB8B63_20455 [Granulosicoccus sp.]